MKTKTLLFVALTGLQILGFGQTSREYRLKRISTSHYQPVNTDTNFINIPMDFNDIVPLAKIRSISLDKIQSISLVYTKFKVSETFDQLNLNNQRIHYLYSIIPGLKEKKNIQWIWIEQTGCDNPEACKEYFHGLVIKLISEEEILSSSMEAISLKYYMDKCEGKSLDTKTLDSLASLPKSKIIKKCNTRIVKTKTANRIGRPRTWDSEVKGKILKAMKNEINGNDIISLQLEIDKKGEVVSVEGAEQLKQSKKIMNMLYKDLKFTKSKFNGKFVPTNAILNFYKSDGKIQASFITKPMLPEGIIFDIDSFNFQIKEVTSCSYIDTTRNFSYDNFEPPVIIKVLDRNKKWKNCLVATDVTGSMAPYLGQFLYWHKLNLNAKDKNDKFVFFNDGDNMSDNLKNTGMVGGIYTLETKNYPELLTALLEAQQNGGGGDMPENNFEAALKGLQEFPESEGIIMIADNWATPRDMELISKIKVPIHFIICGTRCGVNPAWLELVYKNGGSIHTIESDIERLSKLKENEELVIGPQTFVLKSGKFISKTSLKELGCYPGGGWGQ